MSRLVFTVAVFLVVSAALVNAGKSKCPFVIGKYPFDETKFAGEWNLIAATPFKGDKVSRCGKATVTAAADGEEKSVSCRYTARGQDDKTVAFEVVKQTYKEKSSMGLAVYRKEGTDKWSDIYKKSIVATDYTSYALSVACRPQFDEATKSFGRHLVAEVWSRNETLNQEVLDTLISVLSGYDVDPKTIVKVDRTNCV